jgi:hypothetical protein
MRDIYTTQKKEDAKLCHDCIKYTGTNYIC